MMLLSVPPKYSIAMTMGYLKGKSAVRTHRELLKTKIAIESAYVEDQAHRDFTPSILG